MAAHLPGHEFESLPEALFLSHLYFSPLFLNDFDQVKVLLSGPVKDNPAPHALYSLPPPHPNLSTGVVPNICSCDLARLYCIATFSTCSMDLPIGAGIVQVFVLLTVAVTYHKHEWS